MRLLLMPRIPFQRNKLQKAEILRHSMKKLTPPLATLLIGSIFIDAVQGFVLFNAALCAVPSITGVGAVLSLICGLAVLGISTLGALFTLIWGGFAYLITGEKLELAAGVIEAIPVVNGLPIFTMTTLYYISK